MIFSLQLELYVSGNDWFVSSGDGKCWVLSDRSSCRDWSRRQQALHLRSFASRHVAFPVDLPRQQTKRLGLGETITAPASGHAALPAIRSALTNPCYVTLSSTSDLSTTVVPLLPSIYLPVMADQSREHVCLCSMYAMSALS